MNWFLFLGPPDQKLAVKKHKTFLAPKDCTCDFTYYVIFLFICHYCMITTLLEYCYLGCTKTLLCREKKVVHPIYVLSYSISSRYSKRDDYYFISINYGTYYSSDFSLKKSILLIHLDVESSTWFFLLFQPCKLIEFFEMLHLCSLFYYIIIIFSNLFL